MFKKWFKKTGESNQKSGSSPKNIETPEQTSWLEDLSQSNDFVNDHTSAVNDEPFWVSYYRTLVMSEILHRDVLPFLEKRESLNDLKSKIPIQQILITADAKEIKQMLLRGFAAIRLNDQDQECLLVNVANTKFRDISTPTMEFC
jgi:spore germination protein KA